MATSERLILLHTRAHTRRRYVDPHADADKVGGCTYELTAVLIHSGTAFSGHYYAYVLDSTKREWFNFNDEVVTPLSSKDVDLDFFANAFGGKSDGSSSASAYVLLYHRVDAAASQSGGFDHKTAPVDTSAMDIGVPAALAALIRTENETWRKDRAE